MEQGVEPVVGDHRQVGIARLHATLDALRDLRVRVASVDDVDAALDLIDEAAAWTASIGHENWPSPFPRGPVVVNARAGDLYLAALDDAVVATLALQWSDPYFWGETGDDEQAGYVHRVAVRRTHAGAGLGVRLLSWADGEIRARGRSLLRLDVVSHNASLRRYYENSGFAHVRDATGVWTSRDGTCRSWSTSLYERPCP